MYIKKRIELNFSFFQSNHRKKSKQVLKKKFVIKNVSIKQSFDRFGHHWSALVSGDPHLRRDLLSIVLIQSVGRLLESKPRLAQRFGEVVVNCKTRVTNTSSNRSGIWCLKDISGKV